MSRDYHPAVLPSDQNIEESSFELRDEGGGGGSGNGGIGRVGVGGGTSAFVRLKFGGNSDLRILKV